MPPTVALVTGAYGAIGEAIARQLAERPRWEVVVAGRDAVQAEGAMNRIRQATGNTRVRAEVVDVSRLASVQELVERWSGPLHVLINNAATTPKEREETPEGIERQLATNVLGYFWMTRAFTEVLADGGPSRVINVASYWAGGLDLDDLEFQTRRYDNDTAYRQSKQANRMLAPAFATRLATRGIHVNACHPGDVGSKLSRALGFGGHQTPDEGARTPVWLATHEDGESDGGYFERARSVHCSFSDDTEQVEALYEACERYG